MLPKIYDSHFNEMLSNKNEPNKTCGVIGDAALAVC
jgi:hypothetical protein